ncbi:MAG: tetratricopeptide repeat protein [bacterium]
MVLSYNKLGDVSFKKDDLNEALKYYNKTLKIDSKNIRALYRIGAISFQKENYKTALGYFNKAYKYNTNEDDIESLKWPITVTEFRIKEIAAQKN